MALCAAMLLASGCSALRFGYNQGTDLAYWWLDGYADFSEPQTAKVRDALGEWFAWHRGTQLPDYAALLLRAQGEVLADTTAARACEWWELLNTRWQAGLEHAVPGGAELMLSISPAQVQHIERRYAKANEEFRDEYLQSDPAKRHQASTDRAVDRAESLYGTLDAAQREYVGRAMAQSPFDPEMWLSERKRRQQDALQILRRIPAEAPTRDQAQAALRAYIARASHSPREAYRRYADTLARANCAFAASLHNGTSAAQRQVAAQRLKAWEADARALAAEAAK